MTENECDHLSNEKYRKKRKKYSFDLKVEYQSKIAEDVVLAAADVFFFALFSHLLLSNFIYI